MMNRLFMIYSLSDIRYFIFDFDGLDYFHRYGIIYYCWPALDAEMSIDRSKLYIITSIFVDGYCDYCPICLATSLVNDSSRYPKLLSYSVSNQYSLTCWIYSVAFCIARFYQNLFPRCISKWWS